ncbi:unnamed protein product [Malus baccata var. baccata]
MPQNLSFAEAASLPPAIETVRSIVLSLLQLGLSWRNWRLTLKSGKIKHHFRRWLKHLPTLKPPELPERWLCLPSHKRECTSSGRQSVCV